MQACCKHLGTSLAVFTTCLFFYGGGLQLQVAYAAELIQLSDLLYQGAFRVPTGQSDRTSFGYGGTALAYNAANDSLFMTGHPWYQLSAEIKIPQVVNSTDINDLQTATILQTFTDVTEGRLNAINPSDPNSKRVGGQLVYSGQLYLSDYSYYDGAGTQSASHFVRPLNLSTTGQVKGPFRVGSQYPGFVSGYMTEIPSEWQSQFGGPALTGNCGLAIVSLQSSGPAASVFNPSNVGIKNPVPATPVVGYPSSHPLGSWGSSNPYFNGTTQITGIVFPSGTRSVLFFGRHGTGPFCYGPGTSDLSLAGKPANGGVDTYCYDPADGSKGTHAYPYAYQIWAYDAQDLIAVKNGQKQQWAAKPYSVWNFHLPFESGNALIGGATYDQQTQRLYIVQEFGNGVDPIVQVFKVNVPSGPGGLTKLSAPTNLRVVTP